MANKLFYYVLGGPDGKTPVECSDTLEWSKTYKGDSRFVAVTMISDPVSDIRVSTVFLGLDHSFTAGGPPIVFETMVFNGPMDGEMDRYSTWDDAEEGHRNMVEAVNKALQAP